MPELAVLCAYLLGSISFSILVVRIIARKDIREEGSGNAGATNVLRAYGARAGLLVAVLDVAKGAVAVVATRMITRDPAWLAASAFAVVLGHVFPVFFRFRGGKGVATTVGAFLVLTPWPTISAVGLFVLVVAATRYVSAGSVAAAVVLPLLSRFVLPAPDAAVFAQVAVAFLIVGKHVENLKRLAAGTERRLGQK
jgi:glycerol-3-phosphate acyltransferase PlsY